MNTQIHGCLNPFYKVVYSVRVIIIGKKRESTVFGASRQGGEPGEASWKRPHLRLVIMIIRHSLGEFGNE